MAALKTYRDVLDEYCVHPEAKGLGPEGRPRDRRTVGLLRLAEAEVVASVRHLGKGSNRLEAVEAGLVHDVDEVYTEYHDPAHDPWRTLVVPVLKQMPRALLQERTGLDRSTITRLRNARTSPRPEHRDALTRAAGEYARERLREAGEAAHSGDVEACAAWLALHADAT